MKATYVAYMPTDAAREAGRPALTPELLAASGARYSRNNEGLEAILAKIDPNNLDKSVDSIFRWVDYGHASLADMADGAIFIDGVSLQLAYYVWTLVSTGAGQESSTRYIEMGDGGGGLVDFSLTGLPEEDHEAWQEEMRTLFNAYQQAYDLWLSVSQKRPDLMRLPDKLVKEAEAGDKKAKQALERIRRNYAFDRARYLLPIAAKTNLIVRQSAREWARVISILLSHPVPEYQKLGEMLREELALFSPRLMRHAAAREEIRGWLQDEFRQVQTQTQGVESVLNDPSWLEAEPYLDVLEPAHTVQADYLRALAHHSNRYMPIGSALSRMGVRFGWKAIALAEIRDLNRHRTGSKWCPQAPLAYYGALDFLPADDPGLEVEHRGLHELSGLGEVATLSAAHALLEGNTPSYVYWMVLGTCHPFEHTTTADKYIYEAELRTGVGAHPRYAKHHRDCLALWYQKFPGTHRLIDEGGAEPE